MPDSTSLLHPSLAVGRGLPLKPAELRNILEGRKSGWEEIAHDRKLAAGEEVYPVLGNETREIRPCVITREGTLEELLVGLDYEPMRVFRRTRSPARPAGRKRDLRGKAVDGSEQTR